MDKQIIRIELIFPDKLIKEPVVFTAGKKFSIIPNIIRAEVTEKTGEIELELEGVVKNLERGIRYFKNKGIKVKLISAENKKNFKIG